MKPHGFAIVFVIVGIFCWGPALAAQDDEEPQVVSPHEIHYFKPQTVPLAAIKAEGLILDIGAGEGVIGHLMGSQVVAIDVNVEKLGNRPTPSLKLVMDARELAFLDESFDTATSFFALLRFDPEDQREVAREIYRVLRPGGRFIIWDAAFGPRPEGKQIAVIPVSVKVKGNNIDAGYSRRWPEGIQDLDHYTLLAESIGFTVEEFDHKDAWFRIVFRKPEPDTPVAEPPE